MYACDSQPDILEHYLRCDTGNPEQWLAGYQLLTRCPRLSLKVLPSSGHEPFRARLSCLKSRDLAVYGSFTSDECLMSGTNSGSVAVIMPVDGTVDVNLGGEHLLRGPWNPFILNPCEDFHAVLSAQTHLLAIQLPGLTTPIANDLLTEDAGQLVDLLSSFLLETHFFRSHQDALNRTGQFAQSLYSLLETGRLKSQDPARRTHIEVDRRLCRAIQLLNQELHTDISIESIASRAGLSLRNLHYLMKQTIGQSPYQYVRTRRLIKARGSLIRDYPNQVSIAQQALDWGFQHAGRFASYYHQLFGHYPNETLRELERLEHYSRQVRSVAMDSDNTGLWLTSAMRPRRARRNDNRLADQPGH